MAGRSPPLPSPGMSAHQGCGGADMGASSVKSIMGGAEGALLLSIRARPGLAPPAAGWATDCPEGCALLASEV